MSSGTARCGRRRRAIALDHRDGRPHRRLRWRRRRCRSSGQHDRRRCGAGDRAHVRGDHYDLHRDARRHGDHIGWLGTGGQFHGRGRGPPARVVVLRLATAAEPTTFDPHKGASGGDHVSLYPIYDRLLDSDPETLEPLPFLATSWDFPDPQTLTMTLARRRHVQRRDTVRRGGRRLQRRAGQEHGGLLDQDRRRLHRHRRGHRCRTRSRCTSTSPTARSSGCSPTAPG